MRIAQLLSFSLVLILSSFGVHAQEETTNTTSWSVTFDLEEHFRGDELPRIIHLNADQTGNYQASYHLISEDPTQSAPHNDEGLLEEDLQTYLSEWIDIINSSDLPSSDEYLTIGFGASLTPGWQGTMILRKGETSKQIKFNSLRQHGARPVAFNQLATFVFDVKRLTLSKFGLNRKRAVNPDDV